MVELEVQGEAGDSVITFSERHKNTTLGQAMYASLYQGSSSIYICLRVSYASG
jgi:hypothetical protein